MEEVAIARLTAKDGKPTYDAEMETWLGYSQQVEAMYVTHLDNYEALENSSNLVEVDPNVKTRQETLSNSLKDRVKSDHKMIDDVLKAILEEKPDEELPMSRVKYQHYVKTLDEIKRDLDELKSVLVELVKVDPTKQNEHQKLFDTESAHISGKRFLALSKLTSFSIEPIP